MIPLIFLACQWHSQWVPWKLGEFQQISGPQPALYSRLRFDDQMHVWEILEESGWYPLHDGDVIR